MLLIFLLLVHSGGGSLWTSSKNQLSNGIVQSFIPLGKVPKRLVLRHRTVVLTGFGAPLQWNYLVRS